MEKIRSFLNPGAKHDDEILYGSGISSDPVHSGRTEGTRAEGPIGTAGDVGKPAGYSKGASTSEPFGQVSRHLEMPGSFDNDASSTTAIRGGVPGDSHATSYAPTADFHKDLPAQPSSNPTESHLGRDTGTAGAGEAGIVNEEATYRHGTDRAPESYSSSGRSFPLGGANAPLSDNSQYAEQSTEHATSSMEYPNTGLQSQNYEKDLGGDATEDNALGSYGPESWQHDHNRHGHQFVPVEKHETMIGALLDPHNSNNSNISPAEPQAQSHRDAAFGGTALAGTSVAGEKRSKHSARFMDAKSSNPTRKTADENERRAHQPAPSVAAEATKTDSAKVNEQIKDRTNLSATASDRASDPVGSGFSGPIYKSSLLNKLDPRVKETSPSEADTDNIGQSHTSAPLSTRSQYSSPPLDHRANAQPRENSALIEHHTGKEPTIAGVSGGATIADTGYTAEEDRHNAFSPQGTTSQSQNRGFMGIGDTGFDHDRTELDPEHTTFAPPSATTQAIYHESPRQSEAVRDNDEALQIRKSPHAEVYTESGSNQTPQHHYSQDAAIVGTGAIAAESVKHHHDQIQPSSTARPVDPSYNIPLSHEAQSTQSRSVIQVSEPLSKRYVPQKPYDGQDPVIAGEIHRKEEKQEAEFSKKEAEHVNALDKQHEKETKALEKEHHKEEKAIAKEHKKEEKEIAQQQKEEAKHDKAIAKDQKEHHKEAKLLEKERKQEEKALAKEEKEQARQEKKTAAVDETNSEQHGSQAVKEEKRHEKMHAALDKAQSREEKQFEKAQKEHDKEHDEGHGEKKHKGILGLFHRDKKPEKETEEEELKKRGHSSYGLSGAKPAEAGIVTPAAHEITEHEKQQHEKHERNRLHKDPPASLVSSGNTTYAEKPRSGYASQVTGGTGTTALAQGEDFHRGSHLSGVGNRLDPAVDDRGMTAFDEQNRVIEPQTGLPVDLAKGPKGHGTDDTAMPQGGLFPSGQATQGHGDGSGERGYDIGTAR